MIPKPPRMRLSGNTTHRCMERILLTKNAIFQNVFSTFEVQISISVLCMLLMTLIFTAGRAMSATIKLPFPFKVVSRYLLSIDMVIILFICVEPWTGQYAAYIEQLIDLMVILMITIITLICIERVCAIQFSSQYMRHSEREKLISFIPCFPCVVFAIVYVCAFAVSGDMLLYNGDGSPCNATAEHMFVVSIGLLNAIAIASIGVIMYKVATSRRQHTRRITRMGLPASHARNATDTHLSAILLILYPSSVLLSAGLVLLQKINSTPYRNMEPWIAIAVPLFVCTIHFILYICWFDECRLYTLSLLSPISPTVRVRVRAMRIQVYNIVIANDQSHNTPSPYHSCSTNRHEESVNVGPGNKSLGLFQVFPSTSQSRLSTNITTENCPLAKKAVRNSKSTLQDIPEVD